MSMFFFAKTRVKTAFRCPQKSLQKTYQTKKQTDKQTDTIWPTPSPARLRFETPKTQIPFEVALETWS